MRILKYILSQMRVDSTRFHQDVRKRMILMVGIAAVDSLDCFHFHVSLISSCIPVKGHLKAGQDAKCM
jgi:hypothetical protein